MADLAAAEKTAAQDRRAAEPAEPVAPADDLEDQWCALDRDRQRFIETKEYLRNVLFQFMLGTQTDVGEACVVRSFHSASHSGR